MPFLKVHIKTPRSRVLEALSKKQGLKHAIFTPNKVRYIGEWSDDRKTGKGSSLSARGELYEGDFEADLRHGFGVLSLRCPKSRIQALVYRGFWRRGLMHGFGVRRYVSDGSTYAGNWIDGKRHGYGHIWYTNGDFYAGEFEQDQRSGPGMLVYAVTGNRYEGMWRNDCRHGHGKYFHLDSGQIQIGVWSDDVCVYSVIKDMLCRQRALEATQFPIPAIGLVDAISVSTKAELKALEAEVEGSCLNLINTDEISDL